MVAAAQTALVPELGELVRALVEVAVGEGVAASRPSPRPGGPGAPARTCPGTSSMAHLLAPDVVVRFLASCLRRWGSSPTPTSASAEPRRRGPVVRERATAVALSGRVDGRGARCGAAQDQRRARCTPRQRDGRVARQLPRRAGLRRGGARRCDRTRATCSATCATWSVPWWTLTAGFGGAIVVVAGAVSVETIGVAVFSVAFFAGQIVFGLLVDAPRDRAARSPSHHHRRGCRRSGWRSSR